jgi:hypothetical protein
VSGPARVRIERCTEAAGPNRIPALVERLVYLGSTTQVMLRLAPGTQVQSLVRNDGEQLHLSQGTPVQVFLAPEALRVLSGDEAITSNADAGSAPVSAS